MHDSANPPQFISGSESSRFSFPVSSWIRDINRPNHCVFQPVWAGQGHWLAVTWWNTSDWLQLKPSRGSGSADPAQSSDLSRTSSMSESSTRTLIQSNVSVCQSALGMGDMGLKIYHDNSWYLLRWRYQWR